MSGDRFLVHQVVGTTFSFYSDKDIRNISVKRVTSAVAFDGMQHAIQGYVACRRGRVFAHGFRPGVATCYMVCCRPCPCLLVGHACGAWGGS